MGDTATYWANKANNGVRCGDNNRTSNVAQDMLITKAYAEMYLSNPAVFKWAGMAAFASDTVGMGIQIGKATDMVIDGQVRLNAAQTLPFDKAFRVPPTARINATDLDNLLIEGNKAVYRDVYWQHLVYREKGVEELRGLLKNLAAQGRDILINGWTMIDAGAKASNSGLI
ncbi:MAG TPA: hypothetical protein VJR89_07655 [Polyangiales bacterium]|nr:hypothetical protein [Polyangiales bacterium]